MTKHEDQMCTACKATVTGRQLDKGHRQFYEFIVIGYLDHVSRNILCTDCEVKLNKVLNPKH